jgi:membrane protease YdiL (CAAX protease family)
MYPRNDLDLTWEFTLLAVTALGLLVLLLLAIGLVLVVRWAAAAVVRWRRLSSHRKPGPTGIAVQSGPRYARAFILLPLLAVVGLAVVFGWSLARPQDEDTADLVPTRLSQSP